MQQKRAHLNQVTTKTNRTKQNRKEQRMVSLERTPAMIQTKRNFQNEGSLI